MKGFVVGCVVLWFVWILREAYHKRGGDW